MDPLQLVGSLVAILALAGIAAWARLGGEPALASQEDAIEAAGEVDDGFDAVAIAIDTDGKAAVLRGSDDRILAIRLHGNKFVGRVLTERAKAMADGDRLVIETGEKRFGSVALTRRDAETWAAAINRLGGAAHA